MTPQADTDEVQALLARATRRVTFILAMHGATTGLGVALLGALILGAIHGGWAPPSPVISGALVGLGAVAGLLRGRTHHAGIAAIVERRAPQYRNVLVTASELLHQQPAVDSYVSGLVLRDAARTSRTVELPELLPVRGAITALAVTAGLWVVAATHDAAPRPTLGAGTTAANPLAATIRGIDVEITPPSYMASVSRQLHDPARIEALAGSHLRLIVRADASGVTMEEIAGKRSLQQAAPQQFAADVVVDADGYIALEPVAASGVAGPRRLIGISATADQAPVVRIAAPGRDEKFTDGHHTIDLAIEATDDNALATLRLKYTRVAGSGERFTFTDGEVALNVSRVDARNWKAHASWRLDSLALGPGDMVVYRAIATDRRPGAVPTESDSYIAEVLAPGGIAAAGFATDPEVERYALSEQMVILKTERLMARKGLAPDSLADGAAEIAAEQRRVRAEYVFMMGGEVGGADDATGDLNEEVEASGEGDLAVQRMLNEGRAALLGAIRAMSRAATALTTPDLAAGLAQEKVALAQIERTFAHSKIILRALTERERLDLTRRLSGTLADAARDVRPLLDAPADPRIVALRQMLSGIASLSGDSGRTASAQLSTLAERALRLDPSGTAMQRIAAQLDSAATAIAGRQTLQVHALLDRAARGVTQLLRADLLAAPLGARSFDTAATSGAYADAMRRLRNRP